MNGKKYLMVMVFVVSLANGYWASLTQGGSGHAQGSPVLLSMISVWACYFAVSWLFAGMRAEKAAPSRRAARSR